MKTYLLGLAAGVALAGPAMSADIPVKAPAAEAAYSWTGFYFGGSAGYHNIRANGYSVVPADTQTNGFWNVTACFVAGNCSPDHPSKSGSGGVFGGYIGYNRQFQNVVLGIETDLQVSTASARHHRDVPASITTSIPFSTSVETDVNWFGTVRARAGLVVAPRHLAYVTGGWAYGQVERHWQQRYIGSGTNATAGAKTTVATGYAVGAGWDWAVTQHVRFGVEYLFVHLGGDEVFRSAFVPAPGAGTSAANSNFIVRNGDVSNHIARVRLSIGNWLAEPAAVAAANFPIKAPVATPAIYDWTGFYVGANGGYQNLRASSYTAVPADGLTNSFWNVTTCFVAGNCSPNHPGTNGAGVVGGGHVGYNRQFYDFVLGVETDIQVATARARHQRDVPVEITTSIPFNTSVQTEMNWFGTVRARAGVPMTSRILAYLTGGFAYGEIERHWQQRYIGSSINATEGASTKVATGYAVGGGWDWAITQHIRLGAEYLFVHLGDDSTFRAAFVPTPGAGTSAANSNFVVRNGDVSNHIARVRLSINR